MTTTTGTMRSYREGMGVREYIATDDRGEEQGRIRVSRGTVHLYYPECNHWGAYSRTTGALLLTDWRASGYSITREHI